MDQTSDTFLPQQTPSISHIALDIGESLAKIVYLTREKRSDSSKKSHSKKASDNLSDQLLDYPLSSQTINSNVSQALEAAQEKTRSMGTNIEGVTDSSELTEEKGETDWSSKDEEHQGLLGRFSLNQPEAMCGEALNTLQPEMEYQRSHTDLSSSSSQNSRPFTRKYPISSIAGGRLNFTQFEDGSLESDCIPFIKKLIEISALSTGVTISSIKKQVKVILTGRRSRIHFDTIKNALGDDIEVLREDEMDCLIRGLNFLTQTRNEVFRFSDELVQEIVQNNPIGSDQSEKTMHKLQHTTRRINLSSSDPVILDKENYSRSPNQSPGLPQHSSNSLNDLILFDLNPRPEYPLMLVDISARVSLIKVLSFEKFEIISGTSLGAGTLIGLLSLLTNAESFDEMLDLSLKGDNSTVDMMVGDIYGQDYQKIGLKSEIIASSFGKVFKKNSVDHIHPKDLQTRTGFSSEDISKSLLYAISYNIGQIVHLNAEQHGLDRIYFSGCFIRGHTATISALSYAIKFWSNGTKQALFLKHERYLGGVGACLKNLERD